MNATISPSSRFVLPRLLLLLAVATLLLWGGGCASKGNTRKEQAIERWNATRANVLLGLAQDQYTHGNFDGSRQTCAEALQMSDKVPGLYILKAKLDIERNDLQAASAAVEAARTLAPNNPEPDYLAGLIAERWQQPEQALVAYEAALAKEPAELAYLMAVAEMLLGSDRASEAAAILEPRLMFFESSAPLRDLMGQVYAQLDRHAEASEMWRQALVIMPGDQALRERWALSLMQTHEWRRAADQLERLTSEPTLSDKLSLHLALAECRMQQENFPAARAAFQKAARIDETSLDAWLGVAKASLAGDDTARVELALARAQALRPTGQSAADLALLRGYLRLSQNQPQEAARSFATAMRLTPDDAMAVTMYGLCLQRLGDRAGAMRHYSRALELDPTEPLATELMSGLARTDAAPLDR